MTTALEDPPLIHTRKSDSEHWHEAPVGMVELDRDPDDRKSEREP